MKKTIKDLDLNYKKVIIRVDFNVPIKKGKIIDDNRIQESLPTIKHVLEQNASIILMSHLGRVKEESDKEKNTLAPVAKRLSELLKKEVIFINKTRGEELEETIKNLQPGQIVLMENTRYEDVPNKLESKNDEELGKYWATLGDIFINDAFGTAHRAHASNVGIASHLENAVGLLIEKELKYLDETINNPETPFTVILGGAKVHDKIKLIDNIVKKADNIIIGGGMSYTFLKSKNINIGQSILDEESINFCKKSLKEYPEKIILPVDHITSISPDSETMEQKPITEIKDNYMGLDIGPASIKLFKEILNKSKTIVWNGPLGYSEKKLFETGTKELLEYLSKINKTVVICGGDTVASAINFGYKESFTHISTGGGASLELLSGKKLPGIEIIGDKQ